MSYFKDFARTSIFGNPWNPGTWVLVVIGGLIALTGGLSEKSFGVFLCMFALFAIPAVALSVPERRLISRIVHAFGFFFFMFIVTALVVSPISKERKAERERLAREAEQNAQAAAEKVAADHKVAEQYAQQAKQAQASGDHAAAATAAARALSLLPPSDPLSREAKEIRTTALIMSGQGRQIADEEVAGLAPQAVAELANGTGKGRRTFADPTVDGLYAQQVQASAQARLAKIQAEEAARRQAAIDKLPKPEHVVSAHELGRDYEQNEIAGDQKYQGKVVRISGRVEGVGKDIVDSPYLTFVSRQGARTVQCMLGKEAVGRAAQLRPGNQVVLQGTVKGLMMNVLVDDCIFIEQ